MTQTPWLKWFPGDWRADAKLRACEPISRYVWMEMLGLMHEGEPYGHLTLNGRPIKPDTLSKLIGVPLKAVNAALKELDENAVYSITDEGIIFSRRMVREQLRATSLRVQGAKGGNPALKKQELTHSKDNQQDILEDKAHIPEAISHKEDCSFHSQSSAHAPTPDEAAPQPKRASPRKPDNAEHERFAEFWAMYPRHEGRKPAAKAFTTAAAKHDTERIFAGLDRWLAANAGKDPQYLPHAATWLNQERWTDEPSISNRPQPGRPDRHERQGPITNPMAAAAIESLGRSSAGGWPFDADGPDAGGYVEAGQCSDLQPGSVIIDAMPLFDGRSSVPPNVGYADGGGNRYRR